MRIVKVRKAPVEMVFDHIVDFTLDDEEWSIDPLCEWVSLSFNRNFVVIEHASRLRAGGNVDNKEAWIKFRKDKEDMTFTSTYQFELRCHSEDLSLFMLKYGGCK